jgi:hypothetical protein
MRQNQFDDLTRSAAVTVSRRQVLKTIAGGVLAAATMTLLGGGRAEAAQCSLHRCPHGKGCPPGCICCPSLVQGAQRLCSSGVCP